MNERIRELKKQAWEYAMAVHDGQLVPSPDKAVWPIDKVLDEKFAELIVQECIRKIEDIAESSNDPQPIYRVAVELLEHFGVEE